MSSSLEGRRICFVAGTLGQGGAERQLYYILQALVRSGAAPHVLSLTSGEFWEGPIRNLGVPVTYVGKQPSRLARVLAIATEVRRLRPDLVQSAHFYTNIYAVAAARLTGVPEIGAIRNDAYSEVRAHPVPLGRASLRWPRRLAVNSERGRRNAIALGVPEQRLQLLPNVVDTNHFRPADRPDGPVRIVGIGRLVEQKRFDRFLDVLAKLRERQPEVTAVIAGDGDQREALLELAAERGVSECLEWLGVVKDTAQLLRSGDMLLLTSDHEGTPNVALEAQASGLPVVATRVGGVPEVVQHGKTGFVIDPGDTAGLVESTVMLVRDPATRLTMGRSARAHVVSCYSIESLPTTLTALYARTSR